MSESRASTTAFDDTAQRRFERVGKIKWVALAVALAILWVFANPAVPRAEEKALWEKVRAAQTHLVEWRRQLGTATPEAFDPWGCGLIGVEWSGITTTLGDLEAKRTACNPAWSIRLLRWFDELGFQRGDPVAIYASGSFPGMLLNAIAAAEARELDLQLAVSLGASTWGANHPEAPWPAISAELRRAGFVHEQADYYTLGGGSELGNGLAPENIDLLRAAASEPGIELIEANDFAEMIALKSDRLAAHAPKLLIHIGGAHANMGDDESVLELPPGLIRAGSIEQAGNGVIANALATGTPVLHLLDFKRLSALEGIPYDAAPRRMAPMKINPWWSLAGLGLFFLALFTHRRWRLHSKNQ